MQAAKRKARNRQIAGIKRLKELFGYDEGKSFHYGLQHGNAKPVRLRPNTPPVRDAEHQEKHKKRKAARASRKRNR